MKKELETSYIKDSDGNEINGVWKILQHTGVHKIGVNYNSEIDLDFNLLLLPYVKRKKLEISKNKEFIRVVLDGEDEGTTKSPKIKKIYSLDGGFDIPINTRVLKEAVKKVIIVIQNKES